MNKDCQLIAEAYDQVNNQQPTQGWFRVEIGSRGVLESVYLLHLTDVDQYMHNIVERYVSEYITSMMNDDYEEYTQEEAERYAREWIEVTEFEGIKVYSLGEEHQAFMYGPVDPEMADDEGFISDINKALEQKDMDGLKGLISISTGTHADAIESGWMLDILTLNDE